MKSPQPAQLTPSNPEERVFGIARKKLDRVVGTLITGLTMMCASTDEHLVGKSFDTTPTKPGTALMAIGMLLVTAASARGLKLWADRDIGSLDD